MTHGIGTWMRRKRIAAGFGLLAMLAAAYGGISAVATGATAAAPQWTIGFVSASATDPFWIDNAFGAEQAGNSLKNATVVIGTGTGAGGDFGMIPVVQSMVTKQVNALVVPGIAQMVPVLQQVQSAHIPIIFYADSIPGSTLPVSTVNTNSVAAGKVAGEYIKQHLHGKGTLFVIRYTPGQYPAVDARVTGLLQGLAGSKIKVTYSEAGCDSEAPSVTAMQNALTQNPNLSAVFGQCEEPTLGAQQAIKQAGIKTGKILVVGFDGAPAEVQDIIHGTEDASVSQFPVKMGELAVQTAYQVLEGHHVAAAINPGYVLITKANAKKELTAVR
jgi:ribose transport system substrate-binding protein